MKRHAAVIAVAMVLAAGSAQAQQIIGFSYMMSQGTGNTNDFIDRYSWRGMGWDFKQFVTPETSLGFHVGWSVLHEKFTGTTEIDGGTAISGTQFRYFNAFPFLVNAQYHWNKHGQMRPYVGGGLGVYHLESQAEIGLFAVEESNWHFGLAPEAGVLVPVTFDTQWFFSARWHNAFESGNVDKQQFWTFQIGITSDPDVF